MTTERSPDPESVHQLLKRAAQLARDYYAETGRPLGVTGEVAEFEAARRLGLELTPARHGYDAERQLNGKRQRIEIKGRRAAPAESGKRPKPLGSQKLGAIKLDRQWQVVVLVLLDEQYRATEIYEAGRSSIQQQLARSASKAHERGVLSVSEFRKIAGPPVWERER